MTSVSRVNLLMASPRNRQPPAPEEERGRPARATVDLGSWRLSCGHLRAEGGRDMLAERGTREWLNLGNRDAAHPERMPGDRRGFYPGEI